MVSLFDALTTPQSQYIQITTCSALPHVCTGTTSGRDLLSDNLGISTGRDLKSDNLGLSTGRDLQSDNLGLSTGRDLQSDNLGPTVLSPPLRGLASSLGIK